jgi:hypothetical protein
LNGRKSGEKALLNANASLSGFGSSKRQHRYAVNGNGIFCFGNTRATK